MLAPAKVNLFLHVGPPKPNGRHDLDSLVMFAGPEASDRVEARNAAAPHSSASTTSTSDNKSTPTAKWRRGAGNPSSAWSEWDEVSIAIVSSFGRTSDTSAASIAPDAIGKFNIMPDT